MSIKSSDKMIGHIKRNHPVFYTSKMDGKSPQKRRSRRSWLWTYYVPYSDNRATCKLCDKSMSHAGGSTGNLIKHLRKIHNTDKSEGWIWLVFEEEDDNNDKYLCKICHFKCPKTEDLKNDLQIICDHLKKEHGLKSGDQVSTVPGDDSLVIEVPDKDESEQESKRGNRRWVREYFEKLTDTTFRCDLCKTSIKYSSNMLRHIQRNHSDLYNSKSGTKVIKKEKKSPRRGKRGNRSWVREYFEKLTDTTFRCDLCEISIKYSSNMLRHIQRNHSDLYNSKAGTKVIKKEEERSRRKRGRPRRSWVWAYFVRISDSRATCKLCDKSISHGGGTTGNFIAHLKKVHHKSEGWIWLVFEEEDDNDEYSCRICSFKCTKTDDLKNDLQTICDHLKTEHGLESGDQVSTVPEDGNKDESEDESKRGNRRWLREYFEKLTETTFRCNLCKASIKYSNNLLQHIKRKHADLYNSKVDTKVMKEEHERPPRQHRSWVWAYFERISDSRATCKLCDKSISLGRGTTGNLIVHLRKIHHKSEDIGRPRRSWVWAYFVRISDSRATCKLCDKSIGHGRGTTGNLIVHLKKVHHKSEGKRGNRQWLREYFEKLTEKTFLCNMCKMTIKYSNNMLQHIRRKHSDLYNSKVDTKDIKEENKRPPRKRGRPRRSWVWSYFVRTSDNRATCKLCDKSMGHGFGTTGNLINHLKKIHHKSEGWVWLVFEEEDENDKYSCRICSFKCTKTDDLKNDLQTICDHLKTEHGLESGDQVSTVPENGSLETEKQNKVESEEESE